VHSGSTSESGRAARELNVAPERLERWLAKFVQRHSVKHTANAEASAADPSAAEPAAPDPDPDGAPGYTYDASAEVVSIVAPDGARAECRVPFPPLAVNDGLPYGGLVEHVTIDRRVGVLLVRLGGYAAGVFEGRRLVVSKVGSRRVQGRTSAGGWSQQRFARRREKQARESNKAAADVVARVLLPHANMLDAVIVGGDRRAVTQVLDDSRLAPLRAQVVPPHLHVPDPKLAVLQRAPEEFRSVRIVLA
jgi:Actinobacteria/chloroflexi VLRF1 release factor